MNPNRIKSLEDDILRLTAELHALGHLLPSRAYSGNHSGNKENKGDKENRGRNTRKALTRAHGSSSAFSSSAAALWTYSPTGWRYPYRSVGSTERGW